MATSPAPIFEEMLNRKAGRGLTFQQIGEAMGRDEVYAAAVFYGQAKLSRDEMISLQNILGLHQFELERLAGDEWWPDRGLGPTPPVDPVIYRLYEGMLVYGRAIKAIIHEKFGDGIMSMIDCKVTVQKKPDPKGDRVVLTFDGKFLPYAKW